MTSSIHNVAIQLGLARQVDFCASHVRLNRQIFS